MLAATFGTGQVAFSILWFALFMIEIWLMLSVFIDVFRSHDLRGWAKALWVLFVLAIPLVGILAYFVVRGDKMRAHQIAAREGDGWWGGTPPRPGVRPPGSAHDVIASLRDLAELRDRNEITPDQYRRLRDELLGGDDPRG